LVLLRFSLDWVFMDMRHRDRRGVIVFVRFRAPLPVVPDPTPPRFPLKRPVPSSLVAATQPCGSMAPWHPALGIFIMRRDSCNCKLRRGLYIIYKALVTLLRSTESIRTSDHRIGVQYERCHHVSFGQIKLHAVVQRSRRVATHHTFQIVVPAAVAEVAESLQSIAVSLST
jgi:hypothetical protein